MKTIVKILSIRPEEVGHVLYEQLCQIYPAGRTQHGFQCILPDYDSRVQNIIDHLKQHGFFPGDRISPEQPNEFWMRLERTYDREDYQHAYLLVPKPRIPLRSYNRSEQGLIELEAESLHSTLEIGFPDWAWIVVSDRVRRLLHRTDLKRIIFTATEVVNSEMKDVTDPFWELTSDYYLPPLSSTCSLVTREGRPFNGDYTKGCHIDEGLYEVPQLHYKSSVTRTVESFDLGLTRERFGNFDHVAYPLLVASQKFYRFCTQLNLEMDWIPVRIDPD